MSKGTPLFDRIEEEKVENNNITETSDVDDSINNNTTQKFTFKEYNNKLVVDTYSGRE